MPRHVGAVDRKDYVSRDDDGLLHERLSKALIRIRDENGLLNKEMAERLRVTEGYMSQVLHGRRDVRLSMLNRMSKEFGVDASELITDAEKAKAARGGGAEPTPRRRYKAAEAEGAAVTA